MIYLCCIVLAIDSAFTNSKMSTLFELFLNVVTLIQRFIGFTDQFNSL